MKQQSFVLFFSLLFAFGAADDLAAIRNLCRFQTGLFAHPNSFFCYQYIECVFVSGIVRTCPDNHIWDQTERGCVPGDIVTCERSTEENPPTVPGPDFPTIMPPLLPPIDIDTICDGLSFAIFEIPGNCTHFVFCLFESAQISSCPPDTLFDINREGCFAGNPDTCEFFGPTQPPATTVNTPPTMPPPPTFPPTLPPTETPTDSPTQPPTDPPTQPPTDPPTFPTFTTDQPPSITPPILPTANPTPPIATTPQPPPPSIPPFEVCVGNNGRFVADPTSCARYYFCFWGIPLGGECDWDRIFVESLGGCALGNQQTCERNRNINIEIITNRPIF